MQGVFNDSERNVLVARCASSGGVLGVKMLLACKSTVTLLEP